LTIVLTPPTPLFTVSAGPARSDVPAVIDPLLVTFTVLPVAVFPTIAPFVANVGPAAALIEPLLVSVTLLPVSESAVPPAIGTTVIVAVGSTVTSRPLLVLE